MASSPESAEVPNVVRGRGLGLFILSAGILTLEILQTRIFSYCLDSILFYAAVGVALLGLGASGTVMSIWTGWRRTDGGFESRWSSLFAVTVVLSHLLFAQTSADLEKGLDGLTVVMAGMMALPYVCAGVVVTSCLSRRGAGIHRNYFLNLLGSAAGCFVVFLLLRPLGAVALISVVAFLGVAAALVFALGTPSKRSFALLIVAALISLWPVALPGRHWQFKPEPSGQLQYIIDFVSTKPINGKLIQAVEHFGQWDPTGRIEIHEFSGTDALLPDLVPYRFYSQDGSAGSLLLGTGKDYSKARGFFDRTLYGLGYQMRSKGSIEDVLIIGLGGSPDVMAAHYYGAKRIDGVEINATAIEAIRGPLADFVGDPYGRPGVRIHHMDGRTFARSTDESYDLMVLTGVDTKVVHAAGSLAISENHLYTVEAVREYLAHLEPGGRIAFLRFGPNDRIRLSAIGVAALRSLGVENPEKHFLVLTQQHWTSVVFGRDPITPDELARVRSWLAGIPRPNTGIFLPPYEVMGFTLAPAPGLYYPQEEGDDVSDVAGFFAAVARGEERAWLDEQPTNLFPTTDDRPFFFDTQRRDRIFSAPQDHYLTLGAFLLVVSVLALVFIALPLPLFLRRTRASEGLLRNITCFLCLGVGFMALEIGLVQQLVLFLGHQSYAITVVLATLLVSAGTGSYLVGRWSGDRARLVRRVVVPGIIVLGFGLNLALEHLSIHLAGLPLVARIAVSALALTPLGLLLGVPFPSALARLAGDREDQIPWGLGANGFASVIGASAALPAAMLLGYQALILIAFALYVVAALTFPRVAPERPPLLA